MLKRDDLRTDSILIAQTPPGMTLKIKTRTLIMKITSFPSVGRYLPLRTPKSTQSPSQLSYQTPLVQPKKTTVGDDIKANENFVKFEPITDYGAWRRARPANYYEIVTVPGRPHYIRGGGGDAGSVYVSVHPAGEEAEKKFEKILSPEEYDLSLIAAAEGYYYDLTPEIAKLVLDLEPELVGAKQQPTPERDFEWYRENGVGWGETPPGTQVLPQKSEAMTYTPRKDFLKLAGMASNYLHYLVDVATNLKGEERAQVLHNAVESGEWSDIRLCADVTSWEKKGKPARVPVKLGPIINPIPLPLGQEFPKYIPGIATKSLEHPGYLCINWREFTPTNDGGCKM